MIARSERKIEPADWQAALRDAWTRPGELLEALNLRPEAVGLSAEAASSFPFRVPRFYANLMVRGDAKDPLLRQVLPVKDETRSAPGFLRDPVGDLPSQRQPGLLHKYQGRALLLMTGACAIHCRYCFRRHYPYGESVGIERLTLAVDAVAADPSITEIILSGGDPLSLRDERLAKVATRLADIPHLRRLRIHTRLPVTIPSRLNAALLDWFCGTRLEPVMVLHANHARELSPALAAALLPFRRAGVTLLNQAVLLRGVNDSVSAQRELATQLHSHGVLPYYLHLLDRTDGTAHFEVSLRRARSLMKTLRGELPGYLVPRMVREIAGEPYKTPQS